MATQEAVIAAIQAIVKTLSDIKGAPDYAPEQIPVFPFAVAYPGEGTHEWGTPGERKALINVVIEVHVARKKLPADSEAVMAYGDSVPNALMMAIQTASPSSVQTTFKNAIDTFESISQTFGALNWGDTQTIGWQFIVNNIKIRTTLT